MLCVPSPIFGIDDDAPLQMSQAFFLRNECFYFVVEIHTFESASLPFPRFSAPLPPSKRRLPSWVGETEVRGKGEIVVSRPPIISCERRLSQEGKKDQKEVSLLLFSPSSQVSVAPVSCRLIALLSFRRPTFGFPHLFRLFFEKRKEGEEEL